MINLLSAGFSKLFRATTFRACVISTAVLSAAVVLLNLAGSRQTGPLDGIYNSGLTYSVFIISAVVSLYIGQEYSDKAVNKKIMAGYPRAMVFLADYIVSLCAAAILQLTGAVVSSVLAIPLFGMFTEPVSDMLLSQLLVFCVLAVYTALTLFITMLIDSKSSAVTVALFVIFALFMAGAFIFDKVTKMQTNAARNGVTLSAEDMTDSEKTYLIMYDLLPQSQAYAIQTYTIPDNTARIVVCDFAAVTVITAAGLLVFRKKDIK